MTTTRDDGRKTYQISISDERVGVAELNAWVPREDDPDDEDLALERKLKRLGFADVAVYGGTATVGPPSK